MNKFQAPEKFPGFIARVLLIPNGFQGFNSDGTPAMSTDQPVELVVDASGIMYWAACGLLSPIIWDPMAGGPLSAKNYADPRTKFRAFCIGEEPEDVTGFGWYTDEGELVEELPPNAGGLLNFPPDRRQQVAEQLAQFAKAE